MKKTVGQKAINLILAAAIALGATAPAHADWGYRHGGYGHHHHYRGGYRGGDWVGPAALLAITGLAIGAAAYSQPAPAAVYTAPPPPPVYSAPRPNPGYWYYCGSSGQYYPYTNACPEGWQAVPAR